jgi:hypothetical protein
MPSRRRLRHGLQHVGAQVFLQVDLDLAVLAGKGAQVFGQELHDGRDVGVHAHMAAHAVGVFAELALHALQAVQHGAGVVQQARPPASGHATAVAVEQGVSTASRSDRRLLTAEAAMNSRSAARPMLPSSHTATNSCSEVRSMRRAKLRSEFHGGCSSSRFEMRYRFSMALKPCHLHGDG